MADSYKSDFLRVLNARGMIHQGSDLAGLDALAQRETLSAYIGFDCTAPSLHVGNLLAIMLLRRLQQTGHRPIIVIGGGTTRIGDPSGRDDTRQMLTPEEIAENSAGITRVFDRFLDLNESLVVDNYDWLKDLNYIPFLRDMGRHFSINRMLTMDSVRLRLEREQPLSFIEFNYMILQAYDFLELYRRHGCRLQMGGADQWGNIVNGIELARRVDGAQLFALTTPLLTTASGAKMGKTAKGAIWLDAGMCAPYEYWQYWRNTQDADVGRFLRLFTDVPLDEIKKLEALEGQEINEAKKHLADEATALAHGQEASQKASEAASGAFEARRLDADVPSTSLPRKELKDGLGLLAALQKCGLTASNSEGRRAVRAGAVHVNDVLISDEAMHLTLEDAIAEGGIKLSLGKKRHARLVPDK